MNTALIIAGGNGTRMGQDVPKQFLNVYDKPIIVYTLEIFQKHPEIDSIVISCLEGWEEMVRSYARQFGISKLDAIVPGGIYGQESIKSGIYKIAEEHCGEDDIVLIHDAIRPLVTEQIISDNIAVCREKGNAITAVACYEAMLLTEDGISSEQSIFRDKLKRAQTPQTFYVKDLIKLHEEAERVGNTTSIAACTLMVEMGKQVYFVNGSERNIKLTTKADLEIFKAMLKQEEPEWMK